MYPTLKGENGNEPSNSGAFAPCSDKATCFNHLTEMEIFEMFIAWDWSHLPKNCQVFIAKFDPRTRFVQILIKPRVTGMVLLPDWRPSTKITLRFMAEKWWLIMAKAPKKALMIGYHFKKLRKKSKNSYTSIPRLWWLTYVSPSIYWFFYQKKAIGPSGTPGPQLTTVMLGLQLLAKQRVKRKEKCTNSINNIIYVYI